MADDKTMVISRPSGMHAEHGYAPVSSMQPEVWFEVETMPDKKILLPEGVAITIGRDPEQNLSIADKTMSRNHLVLTRKGNTIVIEVKGLNGLTLNGVSYKDRILDIVVPANFSLGNLPCRLSMAEEVDEDATVLVPPVGSMAHPDSLSPPSSPPPPNHYGSPAVSHSGWGSHSSVPKENLRFNDPIASASERKSPIVPPPPRFDRQDPKGPDYSEPVFSEDENFHNRGGRLWEKVGLTVLCLVIVLTGVWGFMVWKGGGKKELEVVVESSESQEYGPSSISQTSVQGGDRESPRVNDLYGSLIRDARKNLEKGRNEDACDCLKNIPREDPYFVEASALSRQIEGCDL